MKVLIVEDERTTRTMLARYVVSWGFVALTAEDGAAGLSLFETDSSIQIVMTDWEMPRLNGPELLSRLHVIPGRSYTFTLLISARPRLESDHSTLRVRADEVLAKPFTADALRAHIARGVQVLALPSHELDARHALKAAPAP